jgi:hypothetical protein
VSLDRTFPLVDIDAIAAEVEAYLVIRDELETVRWLIHQRHIGVLDLGTVLDHAARHLRLAIELAEKAKLT